PFLKAEFAWYLELNKSRPCKLLINNIPLEYEDIIGDQEYFNLEHEQSNTVFSINYIRWREKNNKEYSRFYYLGSDHKEKYKEYTLLNNKGDHFYHSVFITSKYFDF